jgi:hypothetical protein
MDATRLIQDALAGQCPWPPTTPNRVDQNAIDVEARDGITPAPTQPIPTADAASTAFTKPTAHSAENQRRHQLASSSNRFVFASCTNTGCTVWITCLRRWLANAFGGAAARLRRIAWTLLPVRP